MAKIVFGLPESFSSHSTFGLSGLATMPEASTIPTAVTIPWLTGGPKVLVAAERLPTENILQNISQIVGTSGIEFLMKDLVLLVVKRTGPRRSAAGGHFLL